METWSISYTADKNKAKNRCWLKGKMNYNASTGQAHFYDEEGAQLGKMKLQAAQVAADVELSLWKHLVEIGMKEEVVESIEDVFERLNKELGIEEFNTGNKKAKIASVSASASASASDSVSVIKAKTVTLTKPDEPFTLYDILYTRSSTQKKTKVWHDGFMKMYDVLGVAEYYGEDGKLMWKKVVSGENFKEGMIVEAAAGLVIEVCASRLDDKTRFVRDAKCEKATVTTNATTTNANTKANTTTTTNTNTNTARVFNILYTTDKQKKAKKWIDARLEYNLTTSLARFIDEESGNCFFKKVMREEEVAVGKEFTTGIYIMQIDNEVVDDTKENRSIKNVVNRAIPKKNTVNTVKYVVANENVPNEGRSNEELMALLKGTPKEDE